MFQDFSMGKHYNQPLVYGVMESFPTKDLREVEIKKYSKKRLHYEWIERRISVNKHFEDVEKALIMTKEFAEAILEGDYNALEYLKFKLECLKKNYEKL